MCLLAADRNVRRYGRRKIHAVANTKISKTAPTLGIIGGILIVAPEIADVAFLLGILGTFLL